MAKKHGNWLFLCNFVGMKQTLPDYIKQHDDLRKILLAQEGGIMKYLAEHLDANGTAELFTSYQNQCVEVFFEKNKWDLFVVWAGDDMRRAALGEMEHLWKELRFQRNLNVQLSEMPEEIKEKVGDFTEQYLSWAYKQSRKRRYPKGITDTDVYQEVIYLFNSMGLAYKSMEIILKEHHAKGEIEKSDSDLFTEFQIRQFSGQLTLGVLSRMRQAVAEMLIGKTPEQCRQMAIDTMIRVRGFSQMIYTDEVVRDLLPRHKTMAEQRENDGKWLREVADKAVLQEFSAKIKIHSMRYYFADFVNILKDVGRIWAAQLLVRGIDMKVLEKGVCCILKPSNEPYYYVDRFYNDDIPGRYCISNDEMAEKLLKNLYGVAEKLLKNLYGVAEKLLKNLYGVELPEGDLYQDDSVDDTEIEEMEEQHGPNFYGKDYDIFHENLDPTSIADAVKTLPKGEVKSDRKFFWTVYTAFETLHWLTCTKYTKFISWMKYHSGIHFETNDFKNLTFDEDMKVLLPEIIAVFSDEVDDDCYDDKEEFYRKNPQGDYLTKINKGYE